MGRLTDNENYCIKTGCSACAGGVGIGCYEEKIYNKLKEYEDLEEYGLLLELPCKENEWVWIAHESRKCAYKVLYTCKSDILADMEEGFVFGYTKAEAEKALAEMEK